MQGGGFGKIVRLLEDAGYRRCHSLSERGTPRRVIQSLLMPVTGSNGSSLGKALRLIGVVSSDPRSRNEMCEYNVTRALVGTRPKSTSGLPASSSAASPVIDGGFVDSGSDSDEDEDEPGVGGRPTVVRELE